MNWSAIGKILARVPRPFAALTVLLLAKMWLFRLLVFGGLGWRQALPDLASAVVIAGFAEAVFPRRTRWLAVWTLNLLVSFALFASTVYFSYFSTIPTFTALNELHQAPAVKNSIFALLSWEQGLYFVDVAVALILWAYARFRGRKSREGDERTPAKSWKLGALGAAAAGLVVSQAYISQGATILNELALAEEIGFVNYQVSALMKANEASARGREMAEVHDGDDDKYHELASQLAELKRAHGTIETEPRQGFGLMKGKNLIMVQLEAVQNFPVGYTLDGVEITPVMNRLAESGYYFPKIFQQIGQGNTSDAEFLANTGIYPTAAGAMSTLYGDRDLPSLPKLLRKYGYVSETFHVNDVTFWDRDKLYAALGFDRYHDRQAFLDDAFNEFGASDVELYRTATERMAKLKASGKPFYVHLITVSSHHPFKIPPDEQRFVLPKDLESTHLGDYLQSVHYADYALGELVRMLKEKGLYDDSLIVVYGDHFGLQKKIMSPEEIGRKLGISYDQWITHYNIPLIIHVPGDSEGRVIDITGGQVDILPTVANLLGISLQDEHFITFGADLLNVKKNVIGMRYYLPTGSFITNEMLYVPGKSFEDGTATFLDTLEPVADITSLRADYDYVLKLLRLSDAYVESLPQID